MIKRIEYIDSLRGFAMFLVVLGHVLENCGYYRAPLYQFIYAFHMPLFIGISGYVMSFSFEKNLMGNNKIRIGNVCEFIWKKVKQIMIPYYAWSLVALPLFFYNYDGTLNYKSILDSVFVSNTSFWFLPCLFGLSVVYIIYKYLFSLTKKSSISIVYKLLVLAFLAITVIAIYKYTRFDFLRSVISYMLPFFIGVFMSEYKKFNELICDNVSVYTFCLLAFLWIVGLFISPSNEALRYFSRLLCGVLSIPVFFFFFKNTKFNPKLSAVLNIIGKNTLAIYVLQFSFMGKLPVISNLNIFMQLSIFSIISILMIVLCLIISKFFEHSKILKWIFLGKR